MSIESVFRNYDLPAILTSADRTAAAKVCGLVLQKEKESDPETVEQCFALSDLFRLVGDIDSSDRFLLKAREHAAKKAILFEKLGTNSRIRGDHTAMMEAFSTGAAADPEWPYNWLGLAIGHWEAGDAERAAQSATTFAKLGSNAYDSQAYEVLNRIANTAFEAGDRVSIGPLLEYLLERDKAEPLTIVRCAEVRSETGRPQDALALLEPRFDAGELSIWGQAAYANCLIRLSRQETAAPIVRGLVKKRPEVAYFHYLSANSLASVGHLDEVLEALDKARPTLKDGVWTRMTLLAMARAGQVERAAELAIERRDKLGDSERDVLLEVGYQLHASGRVSMVEPFAQYISEKFPEDPRVKELSLNLFFIAQAWEKAEGAIKSTPSSTLASSRHLTLKRFELACFQGKYDEAVHLCDELLGADPPRKFYPPIFRHLAEQKEWDRVADIALDWLGLDFSYDQIGFVLFRAFKASNKQSELASRIEAIAGWRTNDDLKKLRAMVLDDSAKSVADLDDLLDDESVVEFDWMASRIHNKRAVFSQGQAPESAGRVALFLCTDAGYMCPTAVCLQSLIEMSPLEMDALDVFLVVDDASAKMAERIATGFQRATQLNISVVSASTIIKSDEQLDADYGLFTSGHRLSKSAYYRIYFAHYLANETDYKRAVYLDSDVLLVDSIRRVFEADLGGAPMAARREIDRPEVRRAVSVNDLSEGEYFNSGVLVFDLTHYDLTAALEKSIRAVENEETTLLFHDQCALNIGFNGISAALESNANWFVARDAALTELGEGTTVLHFLDRPKPWSAAYDGQCSRLWYGAWRRMARTLGRDLAVELLEST